MPEKAGQYGHVQPLRDAYRQCMDYAFQQVFTGATDYNTAIRQATRNLADKGVRVIDYESGVHTSLEAAVRRNIMGGLGLMQEQISQQNHDEMGANGWEISAHAASAPDHEPIQGRQYSNEAFKRLNGSLKRRIGTLNCGHKEFPIILGVSEPQYTPAELEQMRQQNAKGVTIEGRHYSLYEATQMQRKMERSIRKQKKRILVDKATGDEEKLQIDQTKLRMQNANYKKFSDAAGLRTQRERTFVAGVGKNSVAKSGGSGIIKLDSGGEAVTISSIDSPIEQRHTGKGNPNAVLTFGLSLNNRQRKLLDSLPDFESRVIVPKKLVNMADLAALTAETGVEYAMFTHKGERLIIRGNVGMVNVTEELAKQLRSSGFRWSGHTHPGSDPFCLVPSDGDKLILKCFGQSYSSIYNSKGQRVIFSEEGIV